MKQDVLFAVVSLALTCALLKLRQVFVRSRVSIRKSFREIRVEDDDSNPSDPNDQANQHSSQSIVTLPKTLTITLDEDDWPAEIAVPTNFIARR